MSLATVKVSELPVMEHFHTLQGEGAYSGAAAYFIRLGGCDVGCHWCDVKESWNAADHPQMAVREIVEHAETSGAPIAVVTGGEPLMYDLDELTTSLGQAGMRRHVETSGVYPLTGDWDWITFSPKKFKAPQEEFYAKSHELKVVIYHKSDFAWAETHAGKMHKGASLFLQPEWSKAKEITPLIVDYVKRHPHWRISLQTHKYLDIP